MNTRLTKRSARGIRILALVCIPIACFVVLNWLSSRPPLDSNQLLVVNHLPHWCEVLGVESFEFFLQDGKLAFECSYSADEEDERKGIEYGRFKVIWLVYEAQHGRFIFSAPLWSILPLYWLLAACSVFVRKRRRKLKPLKLNNKIGGYPVVGPLPEKCPECGELDNRDDSAM